MKVARRQVKAAYDILDLTEEEYRFIRSALYIVSTRCVGLHNAPDIQAEAILNRLPTIESYECGK